MGQPAAHTSSLARHHLIGLGFWQAWQMAAFCSSAIIVDTPHSGVSLKTLVIACTTLGYLVVMAANERDALRPKRPFDLMGSSFSMAFGTLVLMFAPHLDDPSLKAVALVFSLATISFGNASLLMMWGELWGTLATGRVGRHLYLSYSFAFLLFSASLPSLAHSQGFWFAPSPCFPQRFFTCAKANRKERKEFRPASLTESPPQKQSHSYWSSAWYGASAKTSSPTLPQMPLRATSWA